MRGAFTPAKKWANATGEDKDGRRKKESRGLHYFGRANQRNGAASRVIREDSGTKNDFLKTERDTHATQEFLLGGACQKTKRKTPGSLGEIRGKREETLSARKKKQLTTRIRVERRSLPSQTSRGGLEKGLGDLGGQAGRQKGKGRLPKE